MFSLCFLLLHLKKMAFLITVTRTEFSHLKNQEEKSYGFKFNEKLNLYFKKKIINL